MPNAEEEDLQTSVHKWMMACFGLNITYDLRERNHRFIEEALELVQSCGITKSECQLILDYVFDRKVGERSQEVGGVMVTLAALCNVIQVNIDKASFAELARVWTKINEIRNKQATKPKHSPLPK